MPRLTAYLPLPRVLPGTRDLFPAEPAGMPSGAFLCFLFFVLDAV